MRAAFRVALVWLALHEVRVLGFPDSTDGLLFHRLAHLAVLCLGAVSCLAAARRSEDERLPWSLIGLGLLAWTAGEAWYSMVLWDDPSPPIPSPADAGYQLFPLLLLGGLVLLLRRRANSTSTTAWVDGLIAGLSVSALSAAVVFETLYRHVDGDPLGVAVALAYPLTDMLLLAVIAAALAAMAWRVDRRWALLATGVVSFWLADSLYAVTAVRGDYESGGWFDIGWWAGLLMISAAAWQPDGPPSRIPADAKRLIAVPLAFGSVGLALLLYATVVPVNRLSIALAAASLVAVMARALLTFRDYVSMLALSREEALTDALTGLGNRRALEHTLERELAHADDGDPLVLVLFDLDGFKHYNDNFGHPAGDALLVRLGVALATYFDGRGHAFRMGGDEFCAVFRPGPEVAQPILAGAAAALAEHGEGFHISCSHGSITLPREAQTPAEALGLADQRMYADKQSRRAPAAEQSRDVLLQALAERNPDLGSHAGDVASLVGRTAEVLGLAADEAQRIRLAAELHDIGKVAIPDAILSKPGPLDATEWQFMRRHTLIGERIIAAAPALEAVARLVRSSHERWDGNGYPDRLAGPQIPLGSRIVAIADAFDAMTTRRPYSAPMGADAALAELRRCAGSQFDPVVVNAFDVAWHARPPTAQASTTDRQRL